MKQGHYCNDNSSKITKSNTTFITFPIIPKEMFIRNIKKIKVEINAVKSQIQINKIK